MFSIKVVDSALLDKASIRASQLQRSLEVYPTLCRHPQSVRVSGRFGEDAIDSCRKGALRHRIAIDEMAAKHLAMLGSAILILVHEMNTTPGGSSAAGRSSRPRHSMNHWTQLSSL